MSLAKVDNFSAICGLFRWCLLQLRERVRCARFYPYPAFLLLPHAELVSVCLELNKNLQEIPRARVILLMKVGEWGGMRVWRGGGMGDGELHSGTVR
jgi:hypothetical protein